jgi:methionine biosynthesis protein MetW
MTAIRQHMDDVIAASAFRRNIYNMIPEGSKRILDFGCGNGALLFRLLRDKGCSELFGAEINAVQSATLREAGVTLINANIEGDLTPFKRHTDFFDYIVMHDVVEHLYDPWFTLTKIRSLLSPGGKLLLATPNFHYWALQHEMMRGLFPYGPGLWHTGHIRWYTPVALVELLVIGGLAIHQLYLEIPGKVDLTPYALGGPVTRFQFPPPEFSAGRAPESVFTVEYGGDIARYAPVFYAHKLIAECGKGTLYFEPSPVTNNCGHLQEMRTLIDNPYDIYNPPPLRLLIGDWN